MVSVLTDLLKAHVVPVGQRLIKNKLPKIKTTDNEKKTCTLSKRQKQKKYTQKNIQHSNITLHNGNKKKY